LIPSAKMPSSLLIRIRSGAIGLRTGGANLVVITAYSQLL